MTQARKINRKGVTLLELLVAIGALAVLAALFFPSLRSVREQANSAKCANTMRQFGLAARVYGNEHDGFLPPGYLVPPIPKDNEALQSTVSKQVKERLVDGRYLEELPVCPSMRLTPEGRSLLKKGETESSNLKKIGSYAINLFLTQTKPDHLPGPYWGTSSYPGPSKMLFVSETYFCGVTWSVEHFDSALNGVSFSTYNTASRNHGNYRLNFMFLDGHILPLKPNVTAPKKYDWTDVFDSGGKNGKYVGPRRVKE